MGCGASKDEVSAASPVVPPSAAALSSAPGVVNSKQISGIPGTPSPQSPPKVAPAASGNIAPCAIASATADVPIAATPVACQPITKMKPASPPAPSACPPSPGTNQAPLITSSLSEHVPEPLKPTPSQRAVSMAWLESFAKTLPDNDLTTSQVADDILAPATRQPRRLHSSSTAGGGYNADSAASYGNYAELLLSGGEANAVSFGRPYHYVIHARSRRFAGDTLAMLRKHFTAEAQQAQHERRRTEPTAETFVWMDIFAVDQNKAVGDDGGSASASAGYGGGDNGQGAAATNGSVDGSGRSGGINADLAVVREAIAGAQSVLLVVDNEVAALQRLWCLYELRLAGVMSRPLRVLSYELEFETVRYAIAELDVAEVINSAIAAGSPRPCLRHKILQELLGEFSGSRSSSADAAADHHAISSSTTAPISKSLRDGLVASILGEAKQDQRRLESSSLAAAAAPTSDGGDGASDADTDAALWSAAAIFRLDRAARMLEALGRLAEAEMLFRRVLTATEAALGTEHPDTLMSVGNLASLLQDQRRLAEAEPLLRRVLSATERAMGATHHETAASLEALAMLLEQQGRMPEAESAFRRALSAYEVTLGTSNRDTLAAANHLAQVLRFQGGSEQLEEAEALYSRTLAAYEAALGPEHPDTLAAVNNLALVKKGAGKLEEAEALYRRALDGCEQSLHPSHPHTLSAANNLAAALQAAGQLEAAEALYRRALAGREAELGPSHPDTLGSVNNLAVLLQGRGSLRAAEPLFRRALEGWEAKLGPEHPNALTAAYNLGMVLEALGHPVEALELLEREAAARAKRGEAARATQRQVHIAELQEVLAHEERTVVGCAAGGAAGGVVNCAAVITVRGSSHRTSGAVPAVAAVAAVVATM